MKDGTFAAVWCALLICCALPSPLSAQVAHLTLHGDPGEVVSGGGNFDITYTPENTRTFLARVVGLTNGLPSSVDFVFFSDTIPNAILDFETTQLGVPLSARTYLNAQRASAEPAGHPGLWVAFRNLGPNMIAGEFTIQNVLFAPDPNAQNGWAIVQFNATFKQRAEGKPPVLRGTFSYSAVSEPSTPPPAVSPTISIGVAPTIATEGGDAVFTISASTINASAPTTVYYSITGKSQLGIDYVTDETLGQIEIPAGASSADLVIHILADGLKEKKEKLTIKLLPGPGYKLSRTKKAVLTILNGL